MQDLIAQTNLAFKKWTVRRHFLLKFQRCKICSTGTRKTYQLINQIFETFFSVKPFHFWINGADAYQSTITDLDVVNKASVWQIWLSHIMIFLSFSTATLSQYLLLLCVPKIIEWHVCGNSFLKYNMLISSIHISPLMLKPLWSCKLQDCYWSLQHSPQGCVYVMSEIM